MSGGFGQFKSLLVDVLSSGVPASTHQDSFDGLHVEIAAKK